MQQTNQLWPKSILLDPKAMLPTLLAMEDLMVTMAYFRASENSISGAKQKGHIFKSFIGAVFKSILVEQEEKEAHDASHPSYLHEMEGMETVPYPHHTGHSVHTRFTKHFPFYLQIQCHLMCQ